MTELNTGITPNILEPLVKTPAQRRSELESRRQARLAAMTVEERQAAQQRIDRFTAVPVDQRLVFAQAIRFARIANSIKGQVEGGASLTGLLQLLNTEEFADVNWLVDAIVAQRSA